jgi:hypothetical protein
MEASKGLGRLFGYTGKSAAVFGQKRQEVRIKYFNEVKWE